MNGYTGAIITVDLTKGNCGRTYRAGDILSSRLLVIPLSDGPSSGERWRCKTPARRMKPDSEDGIRTDGRPGKSQTNQGIIHASLTVFTGGIDLNGS